MKSDTKKSPFFSIINTMMILGLIILVAGTYYYIVKKESINDLIAIVQTGQQDSGTRVTSDKNQDAGTITSQQNQSKETLASEEQSQSSTTSQLSNNQETLNSQLTSTADKKHQQTKAHESASIRAQSLLNQSDPIALNSVKQVSPNPINIALLIPQDMIRNFVVFIDNLSRGDIIAYFSPVIRPKQAFNIINVNNKIYLDKKSYQRYDIYANLIDSIDIDEALAQYRILKPFIDEAYHEIGYTDKGFLNKLNQSIDLIVDAPIINYQIELVAPSAMYQFADPQLESLNDVQKLLIRMGPNNTFKIQEKLKQIQQGLQTLAL